MYYKNQFLNYLKSLHLSEDTIKNYRYLIDQFSNFYKAKGLESIDLITEKHLYQFLDHKRKIISDKNYNLVISRLKHYFRFLERNNYIFISPIKTFSIPKRYSKTSYPTLSQDEILNILKTIQPFDPLTVKGKAILELMFSSALRPSEVINLKISNIDHVNGFLFIEQAKCKKDRLVPVGKQALYWMLKYIREVRTKYINDRQHEYVFISHKTGEKLSLWGIRWAVQETLRRFNLEPFKPYSMRSTSATGLLLNGVNTLYISKLLGHSSIKTTQIYLKVEAIDMQREILKKHPRR